MVLHHGLLICPEIRHRRGGGRGRGYVGRNVGYGGSPDDMLLTVQAVVPSPLLTDFFKPKNT